MEFVLISAMILPEDTASNIQVTNGKIFTMNDQSVVVGYACPGLKDSLKLTDYEPTEDISIPESVEVTADVTDFEMDFTATVVSSGLFEDLRMQLTACRNSEMHPANLLTEQRSCWAALLLIKVILGNM